jgi:hypothetical protein
MNEAAAQRANHAGKTGGAALRQGAAHKKRHVRPRRDRDDDGRKGELDQNR